MSSLGPSAGSISSLPFQNHSTAASPSFVIRRQSVWSWTIIEVELATVPVVELDVCLDLLVQ
jgi:hypothetical protein